MRRRVATGRRERAGQSSGGVRIALDATLASADHPTGVEHFAQSLLHETIRLDALDIEWIVYVPQQLAAVIAPRPGLVLRTRPAMESAVKPYWLIAQTWRDRPRVIYSFGHRLPAGCYGRQVVTVHDTAFDRFPDCYPSGAASRAHREVENACQRASRIVVPSHSTRTHLANDYKYPANQIDVIGEGTRACFRPSDRDAGAVWSGPDGVGDNYLLCVGRIDRRKNLERVIAAYRQLVRAGFACGSLVLVGPPDSGSAALAARLAADAVAGERILLPGYLSESELLSLYRGAAALVYPSLDEGFGLPIIEAMACGTPVITSNCSAMAEVAGEAALLVEPNDTDAIAAAMRRILGEPSLRLSFSEAGLQRSAVFTWRRSAQKLAGALRLAASSPTHVESSSDGRIL